MAIFIHEIKKNKLGYLLLYYFPLLSRVVRATCAKGHLFYIYRKIFFFQMMITCMMYVWVCICTVYIKL